MDGITESGQYAFRVKVNGVRSEARYVEADVFYEGGGECMCGMSGCECGPEYPCQQGEMVG